MKTLRQSQLGISLYTIIIILLIGAFNLLFLLKLFTLYTEYLGVKAMMVSLAQLPKETTNRNIVKALLKNANVNDLRRFTSTAMREDKEFVQIQIDKKTKKKTLVIRYKGYNNFISNIQVAMDVQESIPLGENATETIPLNLGDGKKKGASDKKK